MGTWGAGVFDSDHAMGFFDEPIDNLVRIIVFHLADEMLTEWPSEAYDTAIAAADILALWCERSGSLPHASKHTVRRWRDLCLQRFDADPEWNDCVTEDGLDARTERRKIIEATFHRLEATAPEKY